jgi:cell division protein ZapA
MAQISVTVANRVYRMACGEGEEAHIAELARLFDEKISELKKAVGDIGDMRLHVMAGIFFVDEVAEMRRRLAAAEARNAELAAEARNYVDETLKREREAAAAIEESIRRVEGLARHVAVVAREE